MNLGNSLEIIMQYLLIGGMNGLSYRDGVPMVSILVCKITYWIRSMVTHDKRLANSHDFTKLLCCIATKHWENTELKLIMALTNEWDPKVVIYSLWIGSLLIEASNNIYSQ